MFARVVWLRLRRVRDYRLSLCYLPHALATHYFLRLTRARGRCFLRGRKALLNDFWYFWSCKSTRKEKFLYVSIRRQQATALLENPSPVNSQNKKSDDLFRQRTHLIHARLALSAGVQIMRARICPAFSCDMFARVVWLRLRRVRDYRLSLCYLPHALATHYFLRLTRARGRCFLRGRKALLNDFWYFSSRKSTIKEKYL